MFRQSYFAFLDILGFKEKIKIMEKNLQDTSLAEFYANDCKEYIQNVLEPDPKNKIKFQIFSDSIVLHCEQDSDLLSEPVNLANLLIAIAKIQSFMSSKGFWLRGAVSMGNLYSSSQSNALMGSALIKAYELESNYAITPRVIIDLEFYSKFSGLETFTRKMNEYVSNLGYENWVGDVIESPQCFPMSAFETHRDNLVFVNFYNDFLTTEISSQRLLEAVDHLRSNLYLNPSVYDKMIWLVEYLRYKSIDLSKVQNLTIKKNIEQAYKNLESLI